MKNTVSHSLVVLCVLSGACGSDASSECDELCARAPTATPAQGACTSAFITDLGYPTNHPNCVTLANAFVLGSATVGMCSACYESIGVSGGDCSAAERSCFGGGGSSADAGDGAVDAASGTPDATMTTIDAAIGGVDTCSELCDLTPTATSTQGDCSGDTVATLGYDTNNVPCGILAAAFAAGTATAAECDLCYSVIGITDEDCETVHTTCF